MQLNKFDRWLILEGAKGMESLNEMIRNALRIKASLRRESAHAPIPRYDDRSRSRLHFLATIGTTTLLGDNRSEQFGMLERKPKPTTMRIGTSSAGE